MPFKARRSGNYVSPCRLKSTVRHVLCIVRSLIGNVEDCNDTSSVYMNNRDIPRCPKSSWLVMTLFFIYILMASIMLVNLLIAIFRYR